ncbi:PAS domain S-box protein [candidate division KSB1 bacterium]|nr:PAS domain S-box protein [candidate division KSB1 bacterium]
MKTPEISNLLHTALVLGFCIIMCGVGVIHLYAEGPRLVEEKLMVALTLLTVAGCGYFCYWIARRPLSQIRRNAQALEAEVDRRSSLERSLRQSEERLQLLLNNLTIGVYRTTPDGRILAANPALATMLGYASVDDLVRRNLELDGFVSSPPRSLFRDRLDRDGEIRGYEAAWQRPGGTEIVMREYARAVRNEAGFIECYEGTAEDITERKQAEAALREVATKYRIVADNTYDWEFWVDADGHYAYVSPSCERITGYKAEEFLADRLLADRIVHPDDYENVASHRRRVKQALISEDDLTFRVIRRDGTICWISHVCQPVFDDNGRYIGTRGSNRDITDRMRAEGALVIERRLFMSGPVVAFKWRAAEGWPVEYVSANVASQFGHGPGDLMSGKIPYATIVHDQDLDRVAAEVARHCESGVPCFEQEYRLRRADGEYRWVYDFTVIDRDPAGQITHFHGYVLDITESKRAEETLRQSEKLLRESQSIAQIGSYNLDIETGVWTASPTMNDIFGIEPDHPHTVTGWVELIHPDCQAEMARYFEQEVIGRRQPFDREYKIVRASDGAERWVHGLGRLSMSATGQLIRMVGTIQDITERKQAEEERKGLEAQLRQAQKLETIGTLAGGVAHDFNNILTPILGYANMAVMHGDVSGSTRADIDHIVKAAIRAKDLVNQILTFSRQTEQERRPMLVQFIIKEALKLLRASIPSTIEISENISTSALPVNCDATQIHQILMNLCTNAFHAMRDDGGVLTVEFDSLVVDAEFARRHVNLHTGRYVCLSVSDTGCGMDPATRERIFDPFFTTKKVGEGSGLGLAVVSGIVTAHGGHIAVQSEPGRGSTFRVYLPCSDELVVPDAVRDEPIARGCGHVLYVDDEPEIIEMARETLDFLGYEVSTRTSPIEALEAFRADPLRYDVVITDQTMPHMTGSQLAQEILLIRPNTPIILTTGFSESVSQSNCRQFGFEELLMKPILMRELSNAVQRCLTKAALS